jgi:hypothetical protein
MIASLKLFFAHLFFAIHFAEIYVRDKAVRSTDTIPLSQLNLKHSSTEVSVQGSIPRNAYLNINVCENTNKPIYRMRPNSLKTESWHPDFQIATMADWLRRSIRTTKVLCSNLDATQTYNNLEQVTNGCLSRINRTMHTDIHWSLWVISVYGELKWLSGWTLRQAGLLSRVSGFRNCLRTAPYTAR